MTKHFLIVAASLCTAATDAAPVVFWASDPVRPNETALVAGADFGTNPIVELIELPNGVEGEPTEPLSWPAGRRVRVIQPVQPSAESLKFIVPDDVQPGAWMARVRTDEEQTSGPFRLNAPTVYWVQGDRGLRGASPGGWLRVIGRCVGSPDTNGVVRLIHEDGRQVITLKPEKASLWSLSLSVPKQVPAGRWHVWVHNGRGGRWGWSSAGLIQIGPNEAWPDRIFNVRDFGATGQGTPRDTLGIIKALRAAEKSGGGVVYFPRGRYRCETTLKIPRRVVLRGERTEWVALFWPDTDEPYVLVQGEDHFGLENLTLYASNYTHVIASSVGQPTSGHVFLRRVRVRASIYRGHLKPDQVNERFKAALRLSTGGGDTVRLGGANLEVTDCDLYGSGRCLFLQFPRGAYIARNRFYNGRWGWYCLAGSDGVIFEDNQVIGADLMSTGGGIDCLYGAAYSRYVLFARNTFRLMHGWDREAMTTDAGYGAYYGHVKQADGRTLVLADGETNWKIRKDWAGAGVFILGGRGMGQYREIADVSSDGRTVTIDRPWTVPPDASSVITITMMQRNYLFIDNQFEDAGIAIQYYGTSIDHVAAGNTATRAGGFYNSGRWYRHYQPSWYCQFLDNEILEGNCYRFGPNNATDAGPSFLGTFGLQREGNPAPLAYCSVHRRNRLHNGALIRLVGISAEHPGVRDVILEKNVIENSLVGLSIDRGCIGVWQRDNQFRNVERPTLDGKQQDATIQRQRKRLLEETGPVVHFTFDEPPIGRFLADESGYNFDATIRGQLQLVEGIHGRAARFDGKSYLFIPDDANLLRLPRVTIAAWIRPDQLRGRWGVLAKRAANRTCPFVLAIRDGRVCFEAADATGVWSYNLTSPPVLKQNTWNHIAATCEEGRRVRLYCNGRLVAEKEVDQPLCADPRPLTIGFEAWGGAESRPDGSGNFRGLIDEVAVWSRVLSPREVQSLFAATPRSGSSSAP
ncbi:MAG: hypothetical protein GXP27_02630 [Planctomycetes bacterium]|nr:hypothetical protein [Planctomycetota bacterium]